MSRLRTVALLGVAGVGAVVRRLGYLLETLEMAPARELDSLRKALTPAYARLDPGLPARGTL